MIDSKEIAELRKRTFEELCPLSELVRYFEEDTVLDVQVAVGD